MNLYHAMIELKNDAQALAFAAACEKWMESLKDRGLIGEWRLLRRKLGLGSSRHSDMMLEIEVESLSQLEAAFSALSSSTDPDAGHLYDRMHNMIAAAEIALFRPYPDPEQREVIALI